MPQMSPMNWYLTSSIFIMLLSFIKVNLNNTPNSKPIKSTKNFTTLLYPSW